MTVFQSGFVAEDSEDAKLRSRSPIGLKSALEQEPRGRRETERNEASK